MRGTSPIRPRSSIKTNRPKGAPEVAARRHNAVASNPREQPLPHDTLERGREQRAGWDTSVVMATCCHRGRHQCLKDAPYRPNVPTWLRITVGPRPRLSKRRLNGTQIPLFPASWEGQS